MLFVPHRVMDAAEKTKPWTEERRSRMLAHNPRDMALYEQARSEFQR